jgi:hypothetical protein
MDVSESYRKLVLQIKAMKISRRRAAVGFGSVLVVAVGYLVYSSLSPVVPIKSGELSSATTKKIPKVIRIAPGQQELSMQSPKFKASFQFDAIAPHWKESGANANNRHFYVRTSKNGKSWSDWMAVETMAPQRDGAPHADEVFPEAPLIGVGRYFQYKLDLSRSGGTPQMQDLTVSYLDTRPGPVKRIGLGVHKWLFGEAEAAGAIPNVISRAGWGSPDPTGNAFHGSDAYWIPQHHPVTQVFIHHTVDSNYKSQVDGASVVRAVWQYHTYTLGWGDIGYNYLVDASGHVYEGRAHGDNVDGGHVYGYNPGSVGVGLLGCFASTDSTCNALNNNNVQGPSSAMLSSLTDLLAWKTTSYEIDPLAQHVVCHEDGSNCLLLYTISGHRDAYPTSCPGDLAYGDLTYIRSLTNTKKAQTYAYSARQLDYSAVSLGDNTQRSVTLHYKNTGTTTWINSGPNPLRLATANPTDHATVFQGSGWLSSNRVAVLNEASVAPGAVGSFTFNIANPAGYTDDWWEYFRLVTEGITDFGSFYATHIVTRDYSSQFAGQSAYPTIIQGQKTQAWLKYKNTGNTSWYDDAGVGAAPAGTHPVRLATSHGIGRHSGFADISAGGWCGNTNNDRAACAFGAVYESDGVSLASNQHAAEPGQIVKFEFPLAAPLGWPNPGTYQEFFQPIVEGVTSMNDPWTYLAVTDQQAVYSSSYAGQSAYPAMQQGQQSAAWLRYRNNGNVTWYDDSTAGAAGGHSVHLATSHGMNRSSGFGLTWGGDRNRTGGLFSHVYESDGSTPAADQHVAQPGQIVEFDFTMTAQITSPAAGIYREYFQPILEGWSTMNDPGTFLDVTVTPDTLSSAYFGQSVYPTVARGSSVGAYLMYKNVGSAPWYDSTGVPTGNGPVVLATSHGINRSSIFADLPGSGWCGNPDKNRATCVFEAVYEADGVTLAASQHVAQPGQVVKFGFNFAVPGGAATGAYREYFHPIMEGYSTMNDPGTFLDVTVQ